MTAPSGSVAAGPVLDPAMPGGLPADHRGLPRPLPAARDLHVWFLDLDDTALGADVGCLSPSERSRASRLVRVVQRQRWMACRAGLRQILAGYLGLAPEAVPLDRGATGKPFVRQSANPGELRFNLSHSGGLGVLVVGVEVEVGVDIELTRPLRAFESLVLRCLAEEERQAIQRLPPQDRQRSFLRYWTHKEAFLKAVGSGLSRPLTSVVVDLSQPDSRTADGAAGNTARLSDRSGVACAVGLRTRELMLPFDGYGAVVWLDATPRRLVESRWPLEPFRPAWTPGGAADGNGIGATRIPERLRPLDDPEGGAGPHKSATAPAATPRSADEIVEWVADFLSRDAGVPPGSIDTAASFDTFGLDSAVAIEMTGDLERWLGMPVDPMLLYDHPTIDALAGHLAARFDRS
jgi:4'-phosphopantetheinyl transferase